MEELISKRFIDNCNGEISSITIKNKKTCYHCVVIYTTHYVVHPLYAYIQISDTDKREFTYTLLKSCLDDFLSL